MGLYIRVCFLALWGLLICVSGIFYYITYFLYNTTCLKIVDFRTYHPIICTYFCYYDVTIKQLNTQLQPFISTVFSFLHCL